MTRTGLRGAAYLVLMSLLVFLASTCTSRDKYAGTYLAKTGEAKSQHEVVIELKENGQGSWIKRGEETSFHWSIDKNEIRLHTKEGGVILANIQGDTLTILLPNERRMIFERSR